MEITIPYRPMPHQLKLHQSKSKEVVAVTGRQIGKTVAAVNELIKRSIQFPGTRNWYVTVDYKQAKRNVWDLFGKYVVPEMQARLNSSELSIFLPNKSKIELIGVENAQSLRGAAVNFMILDEYADFPRNIWPEVLRPMFSTTNGDVWFIGTPKGLGNDLYDKYFTDSPHASKFKFPSCEVENGKVTKVLSDYAKIEEIQRAYDGDGTQEKLYFKQEYLAEFTRPTGTVYAEWNLDNFRSVPYESSLPLHLTMDFGVNDPTALIWIQPSGSEFRVVDYYEARDANINHYVSVIRGKPYKPIELYTGDDAGRARTLTTGTSPIEELQKHGIYVRTTQGLKIPDQIRITHQHIRSLYVDSRLERFRDCLLNYRYPEKRETIINQSNELPIHDQYSHAMRALEYYFVNKVEPDKNTYRPVYRPMDSVIGI